ncbi:MAG: NAD(P)-binding domain-containing protein, partial [Chloroflexi bacterium]|nr:NAD(P)-binding domain-containing protein [Chloroflexota bacterium]
MRIAVVGAGYVGLASALAWSHLGHDVRVLERDARRVGALRRHDDPLGEPLVPELLDASDLLVTSDASEAFARADMVAVAVGTPQTHGGRADLSALDAACAT